MQDGVWRLRRGDFRADWDPRAGRGHIRQSANPYSIDSVLRIVHTLILAREGGLLHSAGAIRNGGFLFSGVSSGPSTADCEKSFHRTGIGSAKMLRKEKGADQDRLSASGPLIQIQSAVA